MRVLSAICPIVMMSCPVAAAIAADPESFTVKSSVEMTTFSDPDQLSRAPRMRFSPDGEYFVIVSSRGSVATNEITSSIRLFRTQDVRALLQGRGKEPTGGEVLATLSAVPLTTALQAYAPVISDVKWTADSKAILYLGQSANGERRLHRVKVADRNDIALTPVGYDVQSFDVTPDTVVVAASDTAEIGAISKAPPGIEVNANARNVTGVPLWTILAIGSDRGFIERTKPVFRLGVVRLGSISASGPAAAPTFSSLRYASMGNVLAVSPNGRAAIELLPVDEFPSSWSRYRIGLPSFDVICAGKRLEAPAGICTPKQYGIVDLDSGRRTALLQAPFGSAYGYADTPKARWSADGRHILVTGTFLPLSGTRDDEVDRGLCNAAVVDVESHAATCLRYSDYRRDLDDSDPRKLVLDDADLSASGGEATLVLSQGRLGITTIERYRLEAGSWRRADTSTGTSAASGKDGLHSRVVSPPLSIWIKQDLDEPPQLWATDPNSGARAMLWDPNPHLQTMRLGRATVYRWKDPSGHEWTGGLVKPVGYVPGRRYPLVIQTYTFAQHQFLADGMDTTAEAAMPLASAGIAVLQIQKRFDQTLTDQEAAIQIPGFEAAVSQLAAEGLVDPKKVGIIGFSRGCYYTIAALIAKPGLFAAATVADGLDQSYMQHRIFDVAVLQDKSTYGASPDGAGLEKWLELAPGFNLDKVRTPLRVEAIGPLSVLQEWELYASLREQKKPVDLLYFPDGQHILRKPLERMASQQGNVDWFRFWLQGYEDPDPAKADQYQRWRELRKSRDAQLSMAVAE